MPPASQMRSAPRVPKVKCCTSKPKCSRCPLRMLADGDLPTGYAVKRRRLIDPLGKPVKKAKKSASAKQLRKAVKKVVKQRKRDQLPDAA